MNAPDSRMTKFIRRRHVLTLGTVAEGRPWCANVFYAYAAELNVFVYTTDRQTRHGREAAENPEVSVSIVTETGIVGQVRGLQIAGRARPVTDRDGWARTAYLKRFPYAAAAKLDLWILEPHYMKYTDNRYGFGKKLIYRRND